MDKRKALGNVGGVELPGPYPFEQSEVEYPTTRYTGPGNPYMGDSRPIADMTPNVGSGVIEKGVAFCVPMRCSRWGDDD